MMFGNGHQDVELYGGPLDGAKMVVDALDIRKGVVTMVGGGTLEDNAIPIAQYTLMSNGRWEFVEVYPSHLRAAAPDWDE